MALLALHSLHESLGATFGSVNDRDVVDSYGDPLSEYRAAQSGCGLLDSSFRDLVRVTGEDRTSFLQGMCTQDLMPLAPGQAAYAAFLTAKGAMVGDGRVVQRPIELLVDTEPGLGASLQAFLSKYLISEDAELADASADWAWLTLLGPSASGVSERLKPQVEECLSFPHWVPGVVGVDLLIPRPALEEVFERLRSESGVRPVGWQAWRTLRIEAGVPRFGEDMGESTIPLEANLERAISYDKGCYIGQEVIARATFRGHMNRKLTLVLLGDQPAEPQSELFAHDKKVGWLTSVVHSPALGQYLALGYVHRDHLAPGTALGVGAAHAPATVTALPLESR